MEFEEDPDPPPRPLLVVKDGDGEICKHGNGNTVLRVTSARKKPGFSQRQIPHKRKC